MAGSISDRLQKIAARSTANLTHLGRKSGKPYQVTIWFVVDGDRILLPTSNTDRQWVRNVRKTAHVKLAIGGETFDGEARFLDGNADRERVLAMVERKYWMAAPYLGLMRLLAAIGVARLNFGAFEVSQVR